jgi:hypothetical protein
MHDVCPLLACLIDATRLHPRLQMGYACDMHWLLTLRLRVWARMQGAAVKERQPQDVTARLRPDGVQLLDEAPVQYMTGVAANPIATIDAAFCLRYGFSDYSGGALNYAHEHRYRGSDVPLLPARLIQPMPILLGSFATVLTSKPGADVPALPGALRCVARVQSPLGKTQHLWAWLGVWVDGAALAPALAQQLHALPPQPLARSSEKIGKHYAPWAGCKVVSHYGSPGDYEAELRQTLGFAPKGKPVSEEILFRSVRDIFGAEAVKRRYRGRELQGLELDIWVPDLRLGFEYQGEQHTKHVKLWHGEDGLQLQQERDARKKRLCKQLGYRIFYFYPNEWLGKNSVLERLRAANVIEPQWNGQGD